MALEYFTGFDNMNSVTDMLRLGWSQAINTVFATGRWGGSTKNISYSSTFAAEDEATGRRAWLTHGSTARLIGGLSCRFTSAGSPAPFTMDHFPDIKNRCWKIMDGNGDTNANVQIGIGPGPRGTLRVWRGDTLVHESAPNVFLLNAWHRLEWDLTIDNSAGSLTVRVDGVTLPGITLTDTQNTANAACTVFRVNMLGQASGPALTVETDDLILMNGTSDASGLNAMKGDMRCDVIAPNNDFQKQFTPNTGTTCWSQIDEPLLSGSDYVDGTAGLEDIYDLLDLPAVTGVLAAQVLLQAFRTGTTFYSITPKLYTNSSSASVAVATLAGTSGLFKRDVSVNPVTGSPWTVAEINALRIGLPVT